MIRIRWFLPAISLFALAAVTPPTGAYAGEGGPFVGVDLGVSEPSNDNYRAHVQTGATGAPFAGFMFNDYVGLEVQGHFTAQQPDNDHRRELQSNIQNENQWTTMAGATAGPRLSLPLGDVAGLYLTGQGGGFKGLGGRLNQLAPGFSVGGGLDFYLTPDFSVGLFGRYNRAYMSPHPYFLVGQNPDEQGPADARWATAGINMTWWLKQPPARPAPPPPIAQAPPPPPPPPPPAKQKIVLRSVHFDFDKSNIRADARPVLDEAVNILKNQGNIDLVVEGHTDGIGTDAYNMRLSQRRADSVKQYLVQHGISPSRFRTEGYGKRRPVASNDTDDGRAQNRRVELHIQ
jgi:OmpA-OmpF porin, OOP family